MLGNDSTSTVASTPIAPKERLVASVASRMPNNLIDAEQLHIYMQDQRANIIIELDHHIDDAIRSVEDQFKRRLLEIEYHQRSQGRKITEICDAVSAIDERLAQLESNVMKDKKDRESEVNDMQYEQERCVAQLQERIDHMKETIDDLSIEVSRLELKVEEVQVQLDAER